MQAQTNPTENQGPLYGPQPQPFVAKVEKQTGDVRGELMSVLSAVHSDDTADEAVKQASLAIHAGKLNKADFGKMVDELPGHALGYVIGAEGVEEILPETEALETVGMNEYDVEDADMTGKYTPAQLNAMPEMPKDNQDKAA